MPSPTDQKTKDKGPLTNFSVTQIVVAGLAAATSFALSSQIGIAGSAIGAAIGAVASAAASQVYRNLIDASAERLRNIGDQGPGGDFSDAADQATTLMHDPADQTTPWQPASLSGRASIDDVAESGTPIAPREVRYAARAREQARIRRRVAVVGAAVGIVAVLAFALITYVATQGAGIGQTAPERPVAEEHARGEGNEAPVAPTDPTPSAPEGTGSADAQGDASTPGSSGTSGDAGDGSATDGSSDSSSSTGGTSDTGSADGGSSPSTGASGTSDATSGSTGADGDAATGSSGTSGTTTTPTS